MLQNGTPFSFSGPLFNITQWPSRVKVFFGFVNPQLMIRFGISRIFMKFHMWLAPLIGIMGANVATIGTRVVNKVG